MSLLSQLLEGLLEGKSQVLIPLPRCSNRLEAEHTQAMVSMICPQFQVTAEVRQGRWYLLVARPGQEGARLDA